MKKVTLKSLVFVGAVLGLSACGGSSSDTPTSENIVNDTDTITSGIISTQISILPADVQAAINGPTFTLSQDLMNTLSYMGNEERLAYDVYNVLYTQYGTKQFTNIATKSEYKHITAVQALVQKYKLDDSVSFTNVDLPALGYHDTIIEDMEAGTYDIAQIQQLYDDLVAQGSASEIEALKVGCTIEVVDINDLNADIALAEKENASDVLTVFNFLRNGSYSHYWAFDAALKSKNVLDGCCSLGAAYCHPEYPENDQGGK